MMSLRAFPFLVSLFTLSFYHARVAAADVSAWGDKYHVHVVNRLPDNTGLLRIHIFSGDDDLGYHDLAVNDDYQWHFRTIFPGLTEFFGHFWWGSKEQGFSVYNDDLAADHCQTQLCYWVFRRDGVFIANKTDPEFYEMTKMYEWK